MKFGTLTQLTCLIFLTWLEKCFEVKENVQKFSFKGEWVLKFICSDYPRQNIWHKVKKFSNTEQDFKILLSNFAGFFDSYCQSLISGKNTGH